MAAAIGWYGPLIDLSSASSHIGDFVQLLVFVHRITPVQYKIARNGGEVVRMDILVGDETRSYFPVTIWQKQMGSQVLAGHVFLLQSVDELIENCRVGTTVKKKLKKVVGWLLRARLTHCGSVLNYYEHGRQLKVNWKVHEELPSQDCLSLTEVSLCKNVSKATFHASVGEIFLPITWTDLNEIEAERMFVSRRLHMLGENSLVEDLITTGCELCGTPVNAKLGSDVEQNPTTPLHCQRNSNRSHVIGTIYRPFLLYVWDDSKYIPIMVSNKAAQLLFGNIAAEKVLSCYKIQQQKRLCYKKRDLYKENDSHDVDVSISTTAKRAVVGHQNANIDKSNRKKADQRVPKPNFYRVWLILLSMLFQHGKNSPLKFKVAVNTNRDWESGRLEMLSVSLPAFGRNCS